MKRLALVCFAFALVVLTALPAYAVMVVTSETNWDGGVTDPPWCLGEDDAHLRNFQGTLQPGESFTVSERLCTPQETHDWPGNGSWDGSSGVGILYKATWSKGQSVSLYIIFPDGTIRYAHKTEGYNELLGCVNPEVRPNDPYRPEGVVVAPAMGGTYQVVLTNTGTKAINSRNPLGETVWSNTMLLTHQQESCPPEDWNIDPA
jgi:hypothetical protein